MLPNGSLKELKIIHGFIKNPYKWLLIDGLLALVHPYKWSCNTTYDWYGLILREIAITFHENQDGTNMELTSYIISYFWPN